MAKAQQLHLHRPTIASELAATAFLLLVLASGAALLTIWIGLGL